MKRAQAHDNFDARARWANGFACEERQRDQLEDAYQHSQERIAEPEQGQNRGGLRWRVSSIVAEVTGSRRSHAARPHPAGGPDGKARRPFSVSNLILLSAVYCGRMTGRRAPQNNWVAR